MRSFFAQVSQLIPTPLIKKSPRQAHKKEPEVCAAEIRMPAERRLGELLAAAKRAGQINGGSHRRIVPTENNSPAFAWVTPALTGSSPAMTRHNATDKLLKNTQARCRSILVISRTLITLSLFLLMPNIAVADAISGAFGKEFGSEYDPADAQGVSATESGEPLYRFSPENPYSGLEEYYLRITPETERVFSIWGLARFSNRHECLREYEKITRIVERTYPRAAVSEPISMDEVKIFRTGDSSVVIRCASLFTDPVLYVQYQHRELANAAQDEAAEATIRNDDTSGF